MNSSVANNQWGLVTIQIKKIKTIILELQNLYQEKLEELERINKETDDEKELGQQDEDYTYKPKSSFDDSYLKKGNNPYLSEVAHLDNKWHLLAKELFELFENLDSEYKQDQEIQIHLHPGFIIFAEHLLSRYQDLAKIKSSVQSQKTFLEELTQLPISLTS